VASNEEKVLRALENPQFDWRTIEGISKETGLAVEAIRMALENLKDIVIRSSIPASDGRSLYTTRRHYNSRQSLLTRSLSAVTGSVKR
jgi:hypothetical protein